MHLSPYDLPLQSPAPLTLASYISSLTDDTQDSPLCDLPQPHPAHTSHMYPAKPEKQGKQLIQTLPTEEEQFPEATFKPTQLQHILSSSREPSLQQYKTPIQQMLEDNLFHAPAHREKMGVGKENKRDFENRQVGNRKPTKYQILLDEYYNKTERTQRNTPKTATHRATSRLSTQPITTAKTFDNQTRRLQTCRSERAVSWHQPSSMSKRECYQPSMPPRKSTQRGQNRQQLQKAVSQPHFKPSLTPTSTRMSFLQRQANTLERRKTKEHIGQGQQELRQIDQCTFVPQTNPSHRQPTAPIPSKNTSYAQMYQRKIRARR